MERWVSERGSCAENRDTRAKHIGHSCALECRSKDQSLMMWDFSVTRIQRFFAGFFVLAFAVPRKPYSWSYSWGRRRTCLPLELLRLVAMARF